MHPMYLKWVCVCKGCSHCSVDQWCVVCLQVTGPQHGGGLLAADALHPSGKCSLAHTHPCQWGPSHHFPSWRGLVWGTVSGGAPPRFPPAIPPLAHLCCTSVWLVTHACLPAYLLVPLSADFHWPGCCLFCVLVFVFGGSVQGCMCWHGCEVQPRAGYGIPQLPVIFSALCTEHRGSHILAVQSGCQSRCCVVCWNAGCIAVSFPWKQGTVCALFAIFKSRMQLQGFMPCFLAKSGMQNACRFLCYQCELFMLGFSFWWFSWSANHWLYGINWLVHCMLVVWSYVTPAGQGQLHQSGLTQHREHVFRPV